MRAFALKNKQGEIKKAWILRGWQPSLTLRELTLINQNDCYLEQVSIDEALSDKPKMRQHETTKLTKRVA